MFKIVFISSGQPSVNPRLVKEADALSAAGYEVIVIYSYWTKWALEADKEMLPNKKWSSIMIGGSPYHHKWTYGLSRIRHKIANLLANKIGFGYGLAELAKGRAYFEMYQVALTIKADLYIAHNLAALPVAVKAAKFHKAKCGFDAEDFHRQETTDDVNSYHYKISKWLEDKYLPRLDYITAASPLIALEYKKLYFELSPIVINNVFSPPTTKKGTVTTNLDITLMKNRTAESQKTGAQLSLFWFSQTIGKGRGLEEILRAMGELSNNVTLSLLGNVCDKTKSYFNELAASYNVDYSRIVYFEPIAPEEIFKVAARHDIGLAPEQNIPYNRDICLTNKIFTYLAAGLPVIASETAAQKQFLSTYSSVGKSYPIGGVQALADIITYYYKNETALQQAKNAAMVLAKDELNWEKESKKFLEIVQQTLLEDKN